MSKSPTHFDPGPWNNVSAEQGIRILEVPNFEAFFQFVSRFGSNRTDDHYLWRGQGRSEWEITSTLARTSKAQYQHIHLSRFVEAIARCSEVDIDLSNNKELQRNTLKVWSLGQHWGLKTPLIDFTVYPYFALFFAFAEPDADNSGTRAVFALDAFQIPFVNFEITETLGIKRFKQKLDSPPYDKEFGDYLLTSYGATHREFSTMVAAGAIVENVKEHICKIQYEMEKQKVLGVWRPGTSENKRIHAQGGWHVYTADNASVETWVRRHHEISSKLGGRQILTKVLIPNSERDDILSNLNKMNVNNLTAFPDFEGAARHCNLALEEKHLGRNRRY